MKFEKHKVETIFSATKEMKGAVGWVSNTAKDLQYRVENNHLPMIIDYVDTTSDNPFRVLGKRYMYFYSIPHEHTRWFWLNHHKLKVGDTVKIVRNWIDGGMATDGIGREVFVGDDILDNGLWAYSERGGKYFIPYFAIEKVREDSCTSLFGAEYRVTLENVGKGVGSLVSLTHEFGGIMLKVNKNGVTLTFGEHYTLPEHFTIDEFYRVLEYIWFNRDVIEEYI